ncbi:hypothetical protein RESH_04158 [Rhodopirellula europaea SH398]|uniref:Uncharacterized protein n=1 Tax=Rhodopirellula europaea SH398 TaxID=1263868 RepID=M5SCA4_9BACT|nr:hypothetical protein RESH_04158 [Rhodopirellula europaea SH398]
MWLPADRFAVRFGVLVGLGIVSIPAGLIASALSKARESD